MGNRPSGPFRITFVHAPDRLYSEVQNNGVIFMPVWAYTLAAHLPGDGRTVLALVDTRFIDADRIAEAELFLYSGVNQDTDSLLSVHDRLKRRFPRSVHVLGGPICWSFDQAGELERLAAFDHLVIGDGEAEIAPLAARILAGDRPERVIRARERFPLAQARRAKITG